MNVPSYPTPHTEDVELAGHIIYSLLLPKVLDEITTLAATITARKFDGHGRKDPSYVRLTVTAPLSNESSRHRPSWGRARAAP